MRKTSLYIMILFYFGAGINHLVHPAFYSKIVPGWIPMHAAMVLISGIAEIILSLLLVFPVTRRLASRVIILLLIVIFPANIQMMINYYNEHNHKLWIAVLRLPIQLLLIWWAYGFTKKAN